MKEVGSSDTTFSIVLEARNNGKLVKHIALYNWNEERNE